MKKIASKKKKKAEVKTKKTIRKAKLVKRPKKVAKKPTVAKVKKAEEIIPKPTRYYEAVGRRKTAVARVRLFTQGEKLFLVNERPYQAYFPTQELQEIALSSFNKMKCLDRFRVSAKVKGGGIHAQAEALRHGIARALVLFNPTFRKRLKKAGYLTRDARMRERKKFGLKRARKAPQWQKR